MKFKPVRDRTFIKSILFLTDKLCKKWALIPFFIGAYSTILFNNGTSWTEIIWKIIRYVSYLMLMFPILYLGIQQLLRFNKTGDFLQWLHKLLKQSLFGLIAILISGMMVITAKNPQALILCLLLGYLSICRYSDARIAQLFFFTSSIFFIITVLLSSCGVIENLTSIRLSDGTIRYAMGFMFPLETQSFLFFTTISYLFAYHERYDLKVLTILAVANYLLFLATDARTSFALSELSILTAFIIKHFKMRLKVPSWLLVILVILIFLMPICASWLYDPNNSIWFALNDKLTGRLELGHRALSQYSITLLGHPITWIGYGNAVDPSTLNGVYNYVDCSYVKILLESGLLFEFLLMIGYSWLIYTFSHRKDLVYSILTLIVLIACILEPRLDQISMNFTLLYLYPIFFRLNRKGASA